MSGAARSLDRRVYLRSHPVLFALLAATRGRPVRRLGRTLLVHDPDAYLAALTRIPLDRTAAGTTGGAAGDLAGRGALFDQHGDDHRRARRDAGRRLSAAGVESLRPVWTRLIDERLAVLAGQRPARHGAAPRPRLSPGPGLSPGSGPGPGFDPGPTIDLVPLAAEIAGRTAAALLDLDVDPGLLAAAARQAGATAVRAHLPGPGRRRAARRAGTAAAHLVDLTGSPLAAVLAVAAVNTTVSALPRAAAWACRDDLWTYAGSPVLVDELLRVTAPAPLLPRVAAGPGELDGCPVHPGDRMLLVARHAAGAHHRDPDPACPASSQTAQLVFGAGPHACPGARLARAQLGDLLTRLAPHRPVVVRARADRRSALPGWRSLVVAAR